MSTKYRHDGYVVCPYYRKESGQEIKCKGLCGTHTINVFADGKEKDSWKYDFCKGLYRNCPLTIALEIDEDDSNRR